MDWDRIKRAALALAVGFAVVLYIKSRDPRDDRQYLLDLPETVAGMAEKKQAGDVRRFIAKDYRDSQGRTYEDVSTLIAAHTFQGGQISIYTLSPEVELETAGKPLRATLKFKAAMARGPKAPSVFDVLPESASIYAFTLLLEKGDDGWAVKSGEWAPVTLGPRSQ